jgi:nitrous oxide reductase accessory protein NosL
MMGKFPVRARATGAAFLALSFSVAGLSASACDRKTGGETSAPASSAVAIGQAECAACGMVVREQPAPRAQAVHRDGTRVFLCSIGELAQYLKSPSPHGAAVDVFVEVLEASDDPQGSDVRERVWVRAGDATYVVGFEKSGVMGRPVLAYRTSADAVRARDRLGGGAQLKTWAELPRWVLDR